MISAFLLLLCNSLFLSLHLSGGTGSFPKPLTAAQEREYLRRCAEGDMEARNLLVEHNLRLVAHIMNKVEEPPAEDWWRTSSLSAAPPNAGQLLSGDLRVDSCNRHLDIAYQTFRLRGLGILQRQRRRVCDRAGRRSHGAARQLRGHRVGQSTAGGLAVLSGG